MGELPKAVEVIQDTEVAEVVEIVEGIVVGDGSFDTAAALSEIGGYQNRLQELDDKIKTAMESAAAAQKSAKKAKDKAAGLFKNKSAIEALQESGENLSNAVIASTEAQKLSFEFQQQLADISKGLFTLGTASVAMNRTVIRELEKRLQGASAQEMSDLVRQETEQLIKELTKQQDIMSNQKQQAGHIRQHEQKITTLENKTCSFDQELAIHAEKDKQLDAAIKQQAEKDEQLDRELRQQKEKDRQLDAAILQQAQKDKELDEALRQQVEKDKQLDAALRQQSQKDVEHEAALKRQAEKDIQHENELKQQAEKDKQLEEKLAECLELLNVQGKTISELKTALETKQDKSVVDKVACGLSIVALIILIIQFFI